LKLGSFEINQLSELRFSIKLQAVVAQIGAQMGFKVWVPGNDRTLVLENVSDDLRSSFLDILPINYDDATLRTIEQTDVIWLKRFNQIW